MNHTRSSGERTGCSLNRTGGHGASFGPSGVEGPVSGGWRPRTARPARRRSSVEPCTAERDSRVAGDPGAGLAPE